MGILSDNALKIQDFIRAEWQSGVYVLVYALSDYELTHSLNWLIL